VRDGVWIGGRRYVVVAGIGAVAVCALLSGCGAGRVAAHTPPSTRATAVARRAIVLGKSAGGRPVTAVELGSRRDRRRVLVVGVIHGDEPAGAAIVRRLAEGPAVAKTDLWLVEDLNPDGTIAATRQNAHGVDLNRNFPFRWRPIGTPGLQQYSGPRALSEPEARIAHRLILRLRPQVTMWFHQPLGVVDESGGSITLERRFARLIGLRVRRLTRYPGSATGWQDHRLPGSTAFVVELPPGKLRGKRLLRAVDAVRAVAR
jgi:protein MpaA